MKEIDNVFSYASQYGAHGGLKVRDYIAIQAMKAIIGNTSFVPEYSASEVAHLAYDYADALIERSKHEPDKKD